MVIEFILVELGMTIQLSSDWWNTCRNINKHFWELSLKKKNNDFVLSFGYHLQTHSNYDFSGCLCLWVLWLHQGRTKPMSFEYSAVPVSAFQLLYLKGITYFYFLENIVLSRIGWLETTLYRVVALNSQSFVLASQMFNLYLELCMTMTFFKYTSLLFMSHRQN